MLNPVCVYMQAYFFRQSKPLSYSQLTRRALYIEKRKPMNFHAEWKLCNIIFVITEELLKKSSNLQYNHPLFLSPF